MKKSSSYRLKGSVSSVCTDVALIIRTRNVYGYSSLAYRLWRRLAPGLAAGAGTRGGSLPFAGRRKACEQTA